MPEFARLDPQAISFSASSTTTLTSYRASSRAVKHPAMPAPITATSQVSMPSPLGSRPVYILILPGYCRVSRGNGRRGHPRSPHSGPTIPRAAPWNGLPRASARPSHDVRHGRWKQPLFRTWDQATEPRRPSARRWRPPFGLVNGFVAGRRPPILAAEFPSPEKWLFFPRPMRKRAGTPDARREGWQGARPVHPARTPPMRKRAGTPDARREGWQGARPVHPARTLP